jgi:hypothetical protein
MKNLFHFRFSFTSFRPNVLQIIFVQMLLLSSVLFLACSDKKDSFSRADQLREAIANDLTPIQLDLKQPAKFVVADLPLPEVVIYDQLEAAKKVYGGKFDVGLLMANVLQAFYTTASFKSAQEMDAVLNYFSIAFRDTSKKYHGMYLTIAEEFQVDEQLAQKDLARSAQLEQKTLAKTEAIERRKKEYRTHKEKRDAKRVQSIQETKARFKDRQ